MKAHFEFLAKSNPQSKNFIVNWTSISFVKIENYFKDVLINIPTEDIQRIIILPDIIIDNIETIQQLVMVIEEIIETNIMTIIEIIIAIITIDIQKLRDQIELDLLMNVKKDPQKTNVHQLREKFTWYHHLNEMNEKVCWTEQ